jgi:hypothetical protein
MAHQVSTICRVKWQGKHGFTVNYSHEEYAGGSEAMRPSTSKTAIAAPRRTALHLPAMTTFTVRLPFGKARASSAGVAVCHPSWSVIFSCNTPVNIRETP